MKTDPILRDVYRMKDQFARDVGNDVGRLFRHLREAAKKHPERMFKPTLTPANPKRGRTRQRG